MIAKFLIRKRAAHQTKHVGEVLIEKHFLGFSSRFGAALDQYLSYGAVNVGVHRANLLVGNRAAKSSFVPAGRRSADMKTRFPAVFSGMAGFVEPLTIPDSMVRRPLC